MGCICAKGVYQQYDETQRVQGLRKPSRIIFTSSRRDEVVVLDADGIAGSHRSRARIIPKERDGDNAIASQAPSTDEGEKKAVSGVDRVHKKSGNQRRVVVDGRLNEGDLALRGSVVNRRECLSSVASVPNGFVAEHVAAGWPSWLVKDAPGAVKGWLPRKLDSFEMLDKIGQGTYSSVYRARDLEKGKIVALKKVRFTNMEPESVRFMAREIHILRRLDHPNLVKLEGLIASVMSCTLYLILEYMDHDLAGLSANPNIKFTEPQIKCYMQQLLRGLAHCHEHGVLHRDIKGSNLLIGDDGILRIADFGLATFYSPCQNQALTSRVVTLWYRPPELLLGATEYGASVDLWSAGCILAELFAGKPILPGRTEVEQLHKIFKLCGSPSEEYWAKTKLAHATIFKPQHLYRRCLADVFRDFPSTALDLLDSLLAIEPAYRGTAASALKSEFFTSKPLACDPASLPKYPPSKELDAKLRDEEAKRQRAAMKGRGAESGRASREPKAIPMPDANAELQVSLQKRQVQATFKSNSEKYNQLESGSSFSNQPPRGPAADRFFHSGQLVHPGVCGSSLNTKTESGLQLIPNRSSSTLKASNDRQLRTQTSSVYQGGGADLSNLSGLAGARGQNMEPTIVHPSKNNILYSGPLVRPGENVEQMLKEHEWKIQQAIRKSQLDKTKKEKIYGEHGHFETRLHPESENRSDA
ncbi:hypothetical protein J5N97_012693 [Dioscorea zingiberensis]|uniref:[RNA-polymerase]-subunit kinase n=1 Tax=Dioscorea zingiberensis TaxID=325984 RepID=A0A9D5CQQ0_9LILI|nr:hypothetical protein J5N97_012693 [Dioscorea zingiberensis]